jgi:NAD(P)H-nitrite reductase large subunit
MKLVIIGNGAAGIAAAEAFRKKDASSKIVMISSEPYMHYSRPRVIEFLAGKTGQDKIIIRKKDYYDAGLIDLMLSTKVTSIDVNSKKVMLENRGALEYDKLIIAAGAYSFIPPVEGSNNRGVFSLRTIDDAKAIIEYSKNVRSAAVIGGGLLGIEAAISLNALGLKTTVVEFFDRLLPRQLDKDGAVILRSMLEKKELNFILPKQTQSICPIENELTVNFKDNTSLDAGLVLFSAGIRGNLSLVSGTGIVSDKGIKVNEHMETNIQDIYACGDIAEFKSTVYGIWPAAREQGAVAGANAAGEKSFYSGSLMSTKLKVAGIDLACLGNIEAGADIKIVTKTESNVFKRLFIKDDKINGAILLGDVRDYQKLQDIMKSGETTADPALLL